MRTEDLIAAIAADTTPPPRPVRRLALGLAAALVLSALAFVLGWGPRPGLAQVLAGPLLAKTVVPAVLGVLALALAARLIRPAARPGAQAGALGLALAGLAAWTGLAMAEGGAGALAMALAKPDLWICLTSVPLLSAAPLAALLWALRAGAATRPALTGAVAGLAAGGLGAALYSLYCSVDMALFVLPAYGAAVLVVTLAGAAAGARALAW
jgi:hypothetical protein